MEVIKLKKAIPGFEEGTVFADFRVNGGIIMNKSGYQLDEKDKNWIDYLIRNKLDKDIFYIVTI